ncbi:MAG: Methylphosphotriester-DNA--protein-cysteine S-methyltransferase (EC / DNA-3-methyladenine glycosylase II [uncultured Nocardioidaceae bacterium]|uniref:DNA-3-methyladenine glycosylase II n=1 Tax=uncultured Nocardioidaceae bacterium TaxID=253824 RepID=A0A6J4M0W4_9ACTN|nr:MAG: Methylphosphotriester-DNA--protein-cysteine S-methyltransferase (EC / DNA-3-methyladenine glycosylase II [uncultured Nocardioidaceae bacterium]
MAGQAALDDERCYRAVHSRDARFDGIFVSAVRTTGIYCRPSCPARTPRAQNVSFFATAAAAHGAGYRACRRCRPDASPGSPQWNVRADVVGRAVRLIADGLVDREGVAGLSARLGYSSRQLQRLLVAELGAGPLALARAHRAQTARVLLESTTLGMAEVAFAAGFASVRQFNETVLEVYATTPGALRRGGARTQSAPVSAGRLCLRLAARQPFDADALTAFWAGHAVPGLEEVDPDTGELVRALALAHGPAVVRLGPHADLDGGRPYVTCQLELSDLRDLTAAVARCRALGDLDADPVAVRDLLAADPALEPSVRRRPGLRVPGVADGFETAVRTVLGQQVSTKAAATATARLTARFGTPIPGSPAWHTFPAPEALAEADPESLGLPRSRARALVGLASAVATGSLRLDVGADRAEARARLLALPGIGPWTADYVAMRALRDPDVLLDTDLAVRRVAHDLGIADDQAGLRQHAQRWSPWRSYAVLHLWMTYLDHRPVRRT